MSDSEAFDATGAIKKDYRNTERVEPVPHAPRLPAHRRGHGDACLSSQELT